MPGVLSRMWGVLYDLVTIEHPEAFRTATGSTSQAGNLSLADSIYFSYSSLTTGAHAKVSMNSFGDTVPITVIARTLTWTEAVIGQLYRAVLIARLVSLLVVQAESPLPDDRGHRVPAPGHSPAPPDHHPDT
jgi:hypothetical protein